MPIVEHQAHATLEGRPIAFLRNRYARRYVFNARTEQSRFLWQVYNCERIGVAAHALFSLRVAAALAAVARRLRVAAALRPAARRFLVCAAF